MMLALLLAAAQPHPQPAPTPAWLAGTWVPVSEASRQDPEACFGEDARRWTADGAFSSVDDEGLWRLSGGKLHELSDAAHVSAISRVKRLGPDRLRLTDADGEEVEWRRCR